MTTPRGLRDRADDSIFTLIGDIPELVRSLVLAEVEAGKAWLRKTSKDAGIGSGWFVGTLFFLFWSVPALGAFIIFGLSSWMDEWLAALLLFVILLLVAAVMGLLGYLRWKRVLKSENPVQSVMKDVEVVRDEF